jgi:multidrug resistance efflux pump
MARLDRVRPFIAPTVIVAVAVAALAALVLTRPEPPAPSESEPQRVVAARTIERQPRSPTLTLHGRLESPRNPTIEAAIEAEVTGVAATEGERVGAGQSLVELDGADVEAALVQRRATLRELAARIEQARSDHAADRAALEQRKQLVELADRGVERARRLVGNEAGSRAELDNAEETLAQRRLALVEQRRVVRGFDAEIERLRAQRAQARARLEQAERDLRRASIAAPFAARVTRVEVAGGDRVRPGDPLVGLFDANRLEVRATIAGPDVAAARRAVAQTDAPSARVALDGERVPAVLDRISARAAEGTGGVDGLFRLTGSPPPEAALGQFAKVVLRLPTQPRLAAVPFSALYDGNRVYVVRDGRMQGIEVTRAGEQARGNASRLALVRSPELQAGDRVVTTQLPQAADGLAVQIRQRGSGSRP